MEPDVLEYTVNRRGILLKISGPWDRFACFNSGDAILKERVLGRSLFDFIAGEYVRGIYSAMHELLLAHPGRRIRFAFRCDSPDTRRLFRMNVQSDSGAIRYTSKILGEEPSPFHTSIDYESADGEFVMMCAWCKRYRFPVDSGPWRCIDTIFRDLPEPVTLSHGLCPRCYTVYFREMGRVEGGGVRGNREG